MRGEHSFTGSAVQNKQAHFVPIDDLHFTVAVKVKGRRAGRRRRIVLHHRLPKNRAVRLYNRVVPRTGNTDFRQAIAIEIGRRWNTPLATTQINVPKKVALIIREEQRTTRYERELWLAVAQKVCNSEAEHTVDGERQNLTTGAVIDLASTDDL